MGIDISHIIRHDFRDINNPKKVHGYIQKTIRLLKEKFCIHLKDEDPRFEIYCEDLDDVRFTLPPYSCMFFLREGFWQIESNYHYCRLFMPYDNVYRLRDYIYDIARALGQNEAWHCTEHFTWNSAHCTIEKCNFEKWIKLSEQHYKNNIPEFIPDEIDDNNYPPIYHDSFIGCNERFDELQSKLNYRLLGLSTLYKNYVQCEKEGYICLVDAETLDLMSNEPISAINRVANEFELIYINE